MSSPLPCPPIIAEVDEQNVPLLVNGLKMCLEALIQPKKLSWIPYVLTDRYNGKKDQFQLLFAYHQNALLKHQLKQLMEAPGYSSPKPLPQSSKSIDGAPAGGVVRPDALGISLTPAALRGYFTDSGMLSTVIADNKKIQGHIADLCGIGGNNLLFSNTMPEDLRMKILLLKHNNKKARNFILGLGSVEQVKSFFSLKEAKQKEMLALEESDFRDAMKIVRKADDKKAFEAYSDLLTNDQRKLYEVIQPLVKSSEFARFSSSLNTYPVFQLGAETALINAIQEMVILTSFYKKMHLARPGGNSGPLPQWAEIDLKTLSSNRVQDVKDRNEELCGHSVVLLGLNPDEQRKLLELEALAPGINLIHFLSTQWDKQYNKVFMLKDAEITKFFKQSYAKQKELLKEKDWRALEKKLKEIP